MKMKYKLIFSALLICSQFANAQKKATTGAEDRAFWVKTLNRIAWLRFKCS
jgi:hypothetical protein